MHKNHYVYKKKHCKYVAQHFIVDWVIRKVTIQYRPALYQSGFLQLENSETSQILLLLYLKSLLLGINISATKRVINQLSLE